MNEGIKKEQNVRMLQELAANPARALLRLLAADVVRRLRSLQESGPEISPEAQENATQHS